MDKHVAEAWAVIAPSRWAEPLGLSAVEAIVRGVPVIATATGGYSETVEPGLTVLLFPNGDERRLAHALPDVVLGRVLDDGRLDADAGARLTSRHDPERHADTMVSLLLRARDQ